MMMKHSGRFLLRCLSQNRLPTATSSTSLLRPGSVLAPSSSIALRWNSAAASAQPRFAEPVSTSQSFPSLIIGADRSLTPIGTFAEAQAVYLDPDPQAVQALKEALQRTKTGIVAHYYMDVELQGVLQAVGRELAQENSAAASSSTSNQQQQQPWIGIADSLRMGDMAVDMVSKPGDQAVQNIACLGVDFMSESVQAILTKAGYGHIPVYRADARKIGCSLAESAERDGYRAWLQTESQTATKQGKGALHVVYINTSLETKAVSSSIVPTITCTSSNVLNTLLQASAQMGPENIRILYGPDTYMGDNLVTLLTTILGDNMHGNKGWSDEQIATGLHSQHTRESLRQLRDSIRVFPEGNCVVHHMFGASVVDTVKQHYQDAFVTAHLEVPGEMFEIAMQKSLSDQGVVGSTSDILNFITKKVQEAAAAANNNTTTTPTTLKFILGTEAGMVTSIVQNVGRILNETGQKNLSAEIIFPVSNDAVMADDSDSGLGLVPGVSGGEGCSTAGGCATCPFMKMNDLDALMNVLEMIEQTQQQQQKQQQKSTSQQSSSSSPSSVEIKLRAHLPPDRLSGKFIDGRPAMEVGSEAILYMRSFMKDKKLPEELTQKVMAPVAATVAR